MRANTVIFVVADLISLALTQSSGWSMASSDYGPYLEDLHSSNFGETKNTINTHTEYLYGDDDGYNNLLKWLFV